MICPKCHAEVANEKMFRQHAIDFHHAPEEVLKGDLPVNLPAFAKPIIPLPATEISSFDETETYTPNSPPSARKSESNPPSETVTRSEDIKQPVLPIELTYKYIGSCPRCAVPVTTVLITVASELHCIALCPHCFKTLEDKKVRALDREPIVRHAKIKEVKKGK